MLREKRKALSKERLCDIMVKYSTFKIVKGIKFYDRVSSFQKSVLGAVIKNNIKDINKRLFTDLTLVTLTLGGYIENLDGFNEEDFIDMVAPPFDDEICLIGCNYGEVYNTESKYTDKKPLTYYDYKEIDQTSPMRDIDKQKNRYSSNIYPVRDYETYPVTVREIPKKKKRGRKRKEKIQSKRLPQGSGKYFNSQVSFYTWSEEYQRLYIIKVFRNGKLSVPGVQRADASDVIPLLAMISDFLGREFASPEIKLSYVRPNMRNYKCQLVNDSTIVDLAKLRLALEAEKKNAGKIHAGILRSFDKHNTFSSEIVRGVMKYTSKFVPIRIAEIVANTERPSELNIKISKECPWQPREKSTIRTYITGKVSLGGHLNEQSAYFTYHWYINFCKRNPQIFLNTAIQSVEESDSDSNTSVYED
jgi:hypothetical protein